MPNPANVDFSHGVPFVFDEPPSDTAYAGIDRFPQDPNASDEPTFPAALVPGPCHDDDYLVLPVPQADSDDDLLADAVCQVLAGKLTPSTIARELKRPEDVRRIQSLLYSAQGQRMLFKARRDVAGATTERIKRLLPRAVEEAAKLAFDSDDSRTKAVMLKDLMDRAGIGATQKIAINSPEAYKRAIAELQDDSEEPSGE